MRVECREQKQLLRVAYRQRRGALSAQERAEADAAIFNHVTALPAYRDAAVVLAYSAIGSEAGTRAIIEHALECKKTVLLPVTDPRTETMFAARLTRADALMPGGYGIPEPQEVHPYEGEIGLVLVPGLVFHPNGYRIGYGKGYYDKFFSKGGKSVKIGLAYACQLCSELFGEAHDVRMDYIVTEQGGVACDK